MLAMAWLGAGLSLVVLAGFANALLMAVLWALYLSFVHIGQDWYGYGWEIQLLETGFLAVFLCPLLDPRPFPRRPPPAAVLWLYRWLVFRIMLGAGLIKLRGDSCWRDLTCLYYHYETQPLPNPLSRWLHFKPRWFQRCGVLFNHVAELVVLVAVLSIDPVRNLLSERQMMNTAFNRLELVNTYGAFGSVGRLRPEIVFEGTSDATITDATVWREYEFKCKPGDVMRRPCVVAPYQERI